MAFSDLRLGCLSLGGRRVQHTRPLLHNMCASDCCGQVARRRFSCAFCTCAVLLVVTAALGGFFLVCRVLAALWSTGLVLEVTGVRRWTSRRGRTRW